MNWSDELRAFRVRNNIKQAAAANILGVSQAYISRLEGGLQRPSADVKSRLQTLLAAPEHRPVLDTIKAVVEYSPHLMFLLSLRDGVLWVEAASRSATELGGARPVGAPALKVGAALNAGDAPEVCAGVNALVERGGFEGRLALVDVVWSVQGHETGARQHFRCTLVPVRDETGRWFILGTNCPITAKAYEELTRQWNGPVGVQGFGEDQPAAAQAMAG